MVMDGLIKKSILGKKRTVKNFLSNSNSFECFWNRFCYDLMFFVLSFSRYGFVLRIVLLLVLAWMTLLLVNSALIVAPISLGRALFNSIPRLPITHGIKCNGNMIDLNWLSVVLSFPFTMRTLAICCYFLQICMPLSLEATSFGLL